MRTRTCPALLAVCAATFAWVASAHGATPLPAPSAAGPPVLAGNGVVWGYSGSGRQDVPAEMVVGMTTEHGASRVLARFPEDAGWHQSFVAYGESGIAASRSHYAFIRQRWNGVVEEGREDIWELWAGRLGEPPAIVEEACQPSGVEMEGSIVAWSELNQCRHFSAYIKDLGSQHEPVAVEALGIEGNLQLAGRYIAWWDRVWTPDKNGERFARNIVVHDWRADREVYRVDMLEVVGSPGPLGYTFSFDLQADGKLAVGHQVIDAHGVGPGPVTLNWFSPTEPYPHRVPVHPVATDVAMADDKLVVCRQGHDDRVLLDLSGRVLASFDRLAFWSGCPRASFDGTRVAWHNFNRSPALWFDRVPPTAPETSLVSDEPVERDVALRSRTASVRLPRLTVSCAAYTRDRCRAGAILSARLRSRRGRAWRQIGRAVRKVPHGERRSLPVRLNRRGKRHLRRGRVMPARLRVEVRSPLGETERRLIRLRLRPKLRR